MALTNEQYNQIMHVYDERRLDRESLISERSKLIYAKIPEYRKADEQLHRMAVTEVSRRLFPTQKVSDNNITIRELSLRKQTLLSEAGFAPDFLDVPYVCEDCRDTGYINNERCHCFKQLVNNLLFNNHAGSSDNVTFDDFSLDYYSTSFVDPKSGKSARTFAENALKEAKSFVFNFDRIFANIMLYGKPGTGKTHLSNCISHALLDSGHTVVYLSAFELFNVMKRETFSHNIYPSNEFLRLFSSDLLIIDDLGTEFSNSLTSSLLFELLNERILQKKATVISTNLDLAGFSDLYTERLFSRVMEFYTLLPMIGNDIRIMRKVSGSVA